MATGGSGGSPLRAVAATRAALYGLSSSSVTPGEGSRNTAQASVSSGTTAAATAAKASGTSLAAVTVATRASRRSRSRLRHWSSMSAVAPIHSTVTPPRTTGTARDWTWRYSPVAVRSRKVPTNIEGVPSAASRQVCTSRLRSCGWTADSHSLSTIGRHGVPVNSSKPPTSSVMSPLGFISQTIWVTADISASYRWSAWWRCSDSRSASSAAPTEAVRSTARASTPEPCRETTGEQL